MNAVDSGGSNKAEIDIESFNRFKEKNQDMIKCFNEASNYLATIIKNVAGTDMTVAEINSKLNSLKTVPKFNIENCDFLKTKANSWGEEFKVNVAELTGTILYYEEMVEIYGKDNPELLKTFDEILNTATSLGLFWIGKAALQSIPVLDGLGFMMAYGSDAKYEGGAFIMGDPISSALTDLLTPIAGESSTLTIALSSTAGAGFVFIGSALLGYANDRGDFTGTDLQRVLYDAGIQSLSFFAWTFINAKVGAAAGGVVGAAIATLIVAPVTWIISKIKDNFLGDNVVDTFVRTDANGKEITYQVEKNGHGVNGTFDAYVDILETNQGLNEYSIGNYSYTEEEYKEILYRDFNTVLEIDLGSSINGYATQGARDTISKLLKEASKFDNATEASKYFWKEMNETYGGAYNDAFEMLMSEYHFDFEEYYNYANNIND